MENTQTNNEHLKMFPWSYESPEEYAKADLHIWCRHCNKDTKLESKDNTGIEGGINIDPLKADNKSSLALACEHCGTQLVLHFRNHEEESNTTDIEEGTILEEGDMDSDPQQDSTEEDSSIGDTGLPETIAEDPFGYKGE